MSEPFDKLAATLSKLFDLEKADLDFGIHRIIIAQILRGAGLPRGATLIQ